MTAAQSEWARRRIGAINSNWRGGKTKHPLYEIYLDMIGRCYRPTHQRFDSYGGRGITACDRWRESFWHFVADVGDRPPGRRGKRPLYTLDRVNNDGNYEPSNCRWATYSQQAVNRRAAAYSGIENNPLHGRFQAREGHARDVA